MMHPKRMAIISWNAMVRIESSTTNIPEDDWDGFLQTFSRDHRGWLVRIETHDFETDEDVVSRLEDEKRPRINLVVHSGNKVIKHILFLPSLVALRSSDKDPEKSLHIRTLNTHTTIRLRPSAP